MHIPMINAALPCVYSWSVKFLHYDVINKYVERKEKQTILLLFDLRNELTVGQTVPIFNATRQQSHIEAVPLTVGFS